MTSRQRIVEVMTAHGISPGVQIEILKAMAGELYSCAYANKEVPMAFTALESFADRLDEAVDQLAQKR